MMVLRLEMIPIVRGLAVHVRPGSRNYIANGQLDIILRACDQADQPSALFLPDLCEVSILFASSREQAVEGRSLCRTRDCIPHSLEGRILSASKSVQEANWLQARPHTSHFFEIDHDLRSEPHLILLPLPPPQHIECVQIELQPLFEPLKRWVAAALLPRQRRHHSRSPLLRSHPRHHC